MCFSVGNKLDKVQSGECVREVSEEDGRQFAEQENIDFLETSALSGYCVGKAFRRLALSVAQLLPEVKTHLELSGLPAGWMAVIPEGATDMLQRNSEIDKTDLTGFAAIDPAPLSTGDTKRSGSGGGSNDANSHSAASSPSLGTSVGPTNTLTQRRLSMRKSKSNSAGMLPPPKLKYKYMNYWTGEIFDDEPHYSADAGLLYTAALPVQPSSSNSMSGGSSGSGSGGSNSSKEKGVSITNEE